MGARSTTTKPTCEDYRPFNADFITVFYTPLMFQHLAHFLCALSELFLKFANQLVILAFSVGEIVVGQLSVLLLELALDFIPGALELEFVHINYSGLGGAVGCIRPVASEAFIERSAISR
jgi:hypothetical protein